MEKQNTSTLQEKPPWPVNLGDTYLVGNDFTLADLHGVCGLAPALALLPFNFPKVEEWFLGQKTSEEQVLALDFQDGLNNNFTIEFGSTYLVGNEVILFGVEGLGFDFSDDFRYELIDTMRYGITFFFAPSDGKNPTALWVVLAKSSCGPGWNDA